MLGVARDGRCESVAVAGQAVDYGWLVCALLCCFDGACARPVDASYGGGADHPVGYVAAAGAFAGALLAGHGELLLVYVTGAAFEFVDGQCLSLHVLCW